MRPDEAKRRLIPLFREWAEQNGKRLPYAAPDAGLVFFNWVRANHPELLSFGGGDKWPKVHEWLLDKGLVTR